MYQEITFRDLPFSPVAGEVIFVEGRKADKRVTRFVAGHYSRLQALFARCGLDFRYPQIDAQRVIDYHMPFLSRQQRELQIGKLPELDQLAADPDQLAGPTLLFAAGVPCSDSSGPRVLQALTIEPKWYRPMTSTFRNLISTIKGVTARHTALWQPRTNIFYDGHDLSDDVRESIAIESGDNGADSNFDFESEKLIDEISERIRLLQAKGVNLMFLHELIDSGVQLSRLVITPDFRIFLTDYSNMEITMAALPKAVYILFLRHVEGIRFKELPSYYDELIDIYQHLNPIGSDEKNIRSIRDVTDPFKNSINEKCARIREAFVSKFDDRMARHYYVTGKRGEPKRIMLSPEMIEWQ